MDRRGVRQVPEGCREQRKMDETGCEVICGAPTTPVVGRKVKVYRTDSTDKEQVTIPHLRALVTSDWLNRSWLRLWYLVIG